MSEEPQYKRLDHRPQSLRSCFLVCLCWISQGSFVSWLCGKCESVHVWGWVDELVKGLSQQASHGDHLRVMSTASKVAVLNHIVGHSSPLGGWTRRLEKCSSRFANACFTKK